MGKLTNLFKVVAIFFAALSLGGVGMVSAQGGTTANNQNGTVGGFSGSCATSTYGVVTGNSAIFYAPEQFSTVADAFLRPGTLFMVCTDIDVAGWTAFRITPQTPILFAPAGTFLGFGFRGGFGNGFGNQAGNQVANNRNGQQGSFGSQNTVGGIGGTTQNGVGNNNAQGNNLNNGQSGFNNNAQGNNLNNGQSGFNNNAQGNNLNNNSQSGFNNAQGNNLNNGQSGFNNNNQGNNLNNGQSGFGNNQANNLNNNSQSGFNNNNQGNNRSTSQNGNFGSQIGLNRNVPAGTFGICASSEYMMVLRDAEISFAPQANAGTGQFLRPGSLFTVCGDFNVQGWIPVKLTPQSQIYFVPSGTFG